MDRHEQRPDSGAQEIPEAPLDTAINAEPAKEQALTEPSVEPPGDRTREESGRYLRTAAVSAAVLLFALAFFTAGYWIGDRRGGDENGGGMTASASDDPAWGPEDAAVTIEEFGDFQCPYCAQFARTTLPALREMYGDKVRYIFRDFPLVSIHPDAQKAAEAAQCAHEQGLFWEYHDHLFADQASLSVPDLKRYAEQVGANTNEFNECLDSGKNGWEALMDAQDGRRAGVTGTPAFLINGILLPGAVSFEQFQAIIDQALAGAGD